MSAFEFLKSIKANESQYELNITGIPSGLFSVTDLVSVEDELCSDYCFEIELLSNDLISADTVIGKDTTLSILWGMSDRTISGLVSHFVARGQSHQGYHYNLTLNSHLSLLKHKRSNRIFTAMSVDSIITSVFTKSGFPMEKLDMMASGPTLDMVVQYNETDYQFVERIMRKYGFVYGAIENNGSVRIAVCNSSADFASNTTPIDIIYQAPSGVVRANESIFAVSRKASLLTQDIHLNDYNYEALGNLNVEEQGSSKVAGFGSSSIYGENYRDAGQGSMLANVRKQAFDCQRDIIIIDSDCRAIRPGCVVNIIDHDDYSGAYFVTKVAHIGSQSGGVNYGSKVKNLHYKNQAHLIPLDTPFKAEVPESAKTFTTFNATIEQEVDDKGRYIVKLPFNQDGEGQESKPTRMVQPYGGSGHGMHFPLTQGSEVIVCGENGDLDRPIILGAVYNGESPSPVTSINPTQNLVVTRAGHKLLMDDATGREEIELSNPEGANILKLNASSNGDHFAQLKSTNGRVEIQAKKDLLLTSDRNHIVSTNNVMQTVVRDHIKIETRENDISLSAGRGININAGTGLKFQATENNIDMNAEANINMQAQQNASLYAEEGNIDVKANSGDLSVESGANIVIKSTSNGSINLSQGSGSIEIDAGGNLTIDANTITLSASNIVIKGNAVTNN
ncbi:type VI secretion system tip protein VgrG [Colwellia sp. D2M02]|uniref:type VI secretion system Vgr family protein n=1 Tax=Colwellia sp. D2M02 TaxID=2841562 RepID=UPI001C09C996|nr:type VI secretion system tip protein TssI/VgrG [Colwellia sp. D2M02]MBU2894386.1 type VI secretion system tip protein VgrG [Colwellia sp. D2M02]